MAYLKKKLYLRKHHVTCRLFLIFTSCCGSWQHQRSITVTAWINNFIQKSICMFSILRTLSKFISKLSENCTLVFRNINVLIWYSMVVMFVSRNWQQWIVLRKLSIDCFINGSIVMAMRVTLTQTLTQVLTLTTLKSLITVFTNIMQQTPCQI